MMRRLMNGLPSIVQMKYNAPKLVAEAFKQKESQRM